MAEDKRTTLIHADTLGDDNSMLKAGDAEFIAIVQQLTTPGEVLRFIVENEPYFGYDREYPFFENRQRAMLEQARKVLGIRQ